jgi:phospholipid/cholesterol/gamma-HCH transport system substrate-binding protein
LAGASQPGIGKLTAVAGQIAGDVANVAGRVEVAFDDNAAPRVPRLDQNVSDLSTTLSSVVRNHASDLDELSAELRKAIATLNRNREHRAADGRARRLRNHIPASAHDRD